MSIKISACTIAKNEEKNIGRSIESYKDYVDEIIIVDTGSTDRTVEIAESLGAKVIHFEWINDFSAAKNCALNAATGDWILFLDADEWIKDDGASKLQTVINRAITNGFNAISLRMLNLDDDGSVTETNSSLRLFVNEPNIRYIRKIHEYLLNSKTGKPLASMKVDDVLLNHSGYADSVSKTKINRNKELLEKNYMSGEIDGIDYFYLARENAFINPEYSRNFLDILLNDKEKLESTKKLDMANNIHDLRIKLINILINKYSFNEKMAIIDETIKEFPNDPAYYYFKYVILNQAGQLDNLDLIYKALELDKVYENKVTGNNNVFLRHKADALYEVVKEALRNADTLKAMEYCVEALQTGQLKDEILKILLYIIETQSTNEKVVFLSSIIDMTNEEKLKFIVQTLRLTKHKDLFVYYFVKYYKDFGEVDVSLFTSMLISGNFKDAAEKYMTLFINGNDKRAENLVVSAIIAGELNEFYEEYKSYFTPVSRKLLNAYLEDEKIEEITKEDEDLIIKVIPEILYVANEEVLAKIKRVYDYNENLLRAIIRTHYSNRSYKELVKEINTFIENDFSDEFAGEVTAKLGEAFSVMGEFANAQLYLEQAIEVGYLDANVAKTYKKLMEKIQIDDSSKRKFEEYQYLVEKFISAKMNILSEKIDDIDSAMAIENIENSEVNLTETFKKDLFNYANKLLDMKKYHLAEEYYKILVRANYNLGKCYYALGKIYNKLGAIELSYFYYDKAFRTSIEFPASVLSEDHKNKYYLYHKNHEEESLVCPVCGVKGELLSCYQYIEDDNLNSEASLIVKYRMCNECSHIFAENYSETVAYSDSVENKNEYIFNANDIKEKLEEGSKLVVIDENDLIQQSLSEDFDTAYIKGSLEKTIDVKELLGKADKNRTLVIVINNINNVINKDLDMPLWAKPGTVNAYSKKSVRRLLEDNGYKNIKIYDSKFIPGKMTVVAKV